MLLALHALIYSDDPTATRAFLRDVLQWPFVRDEGVDDGTEEGWLIFGSGPSEIGVHPTRAVHDGVEHSSPRHHSLSLMCDDLEATMAELAGRGATFTEPVTDQGWGITTAVDVPGADPIALYQPRHALAYGL